MLNSSNSAPPRPGFDEFCLTTLFGDGQSNSFWFAPTERLERSPEVEDYTLNFEESVISSHTATDDEIDFRMILPSESHRRRSLGATGRRGSIGSDQGTVSYSSVSDSRCDNLLNILFCGTCPLQELVCCCSTMFSACYSWIWWLTFFLFFLFSFRMITTNRILQLIRYT